MKLTAAEYMLALRSLYPAASYVRDIQVDVADDEARIVLWNLPTPQPTDDALAAALPAAQARAAAQADLRETQALLDGRYRLYNRAVASSNLQDATEIQAEIQELLAYLKEIRDAADPA